MRPTPSAFMMNGPMWSFGGESALKSGTSLPTHFFCASFHQICRRAGSHGLPRDVARGAIVHDAAIHRPRPSPNSDGRPVRKDRPYRGAAINGPASVQEPHQSQLPQDVDAIVSQSRRSPATAGRF